YATSDPCVAPWGGMTSMLGTNPISFAMPAGDEKPVMVDFASAAVAEGKVRAAFLRGEKLPEGWIMDSEGNPTTDPAKFYEPPGPPVTTKVIGAQLPSGGHKGYGLAIVV